MKIDDILNRYKNNINYNRKIKRITIHFYNSDTKFVYQLNRQYKFSFIFIFYKTVY